MAEAWLILAAALQVALTGVAMSRSAAARVAAVRAGLVDPRRAALDDRIYPDEIQKIVNNARNQFETPPAFLAAIAVAVGAGSASWPLVVMAYAWLASRIAHMAIHTGSNRIRHRFAAFIVGVAILAAMWILLVVQAFLG